MIAQANTTGVCCVEFGRLEEQTVLMVRSLRAFGGSLAHIPVIAVVGRLGAPLRHRTVQELELLGVKLVRAASWTNPAPWFNYSNKAAAVITADRIAKTNQVTWLDSDMLFISEPETITLRSGEDLCAPLIHTPPVVSPDDRRHVEYWRAVCSLFDVDFDELPWVTWRDRQIKPNFNSGVFTWRRASGFAEKYHSAFSKLLRSRLAQHSGEFFTIDQIILTPLTQGLRWRGIDQSDHAFSPTDLILNGTAPALAGVTLLHYSTALTGSESDEMKRRIREAAPQFFRWLELQHFDAGPTRASTYAVATMLRLVRGMRYRVHSWRVRPSTQ